MKRSILYLRSNAGACGDGAIVVVVGGGVVVVVVVVVVVGLVVNCALVMIGGRVGSVRETSSIIWVVRSRRCLANLRAISWRRLYPGRCLLRGALVVVVGSVV